MSVHDGMHIRVRDLQEGYVHIVREVINKGSDARPRGLNTREVLGVSITLDDVRATLPVGVGRGVSVKFNAAGAACMIGGVSYPELLVRIAPRFADFDSDGVDRERYGPRTHKQIIGCVAHLQEDPWTREAIAVIQPPRTEDADGGRVFPCTTSLQFLLRAGKLHCVGTMRSNDVWSGLSGDIWTFTQLQRTMAWALGVPAGRYHHNAGSLHIYTGEQGVPGMDRAPQLLSRASKPAPDVPGFGDPLPASDALRSTPVQRMLMAQSWARAALGVGNEVGAIPRSPGAQWYFKQIEPFRRLNRLCAECRAVTEVKDRGKDERGCDCK